MLVTFFCDHCDAKLRITADAMGSPLVCPECDHELSVPRMQLGPGFVVGGFLIKHKLGEGGMGEVYLATQLSLERDVALKILPSRFTRERSFVVRFLKEVHYQAKLDHPNVVAAFDAGEDGGVYYMAMAYVDGETLEERLDREGPLAEKDALQVVRQVGLALQYASEEKGLLHRDIKPGNIMVTASFHAKVLDMGLSKNILEKRSTTVADTLMGTPNYMSPEQIDHPQDLDTRSDMFSLGMTLYHMLTGQVPYEETSYLTTLKRHAGEALEDPRKLMPGIETHTVHLLARMLARDPEDRYASWDLFLEDLREVMARGRIPRLPEGPSSLEVREELRVAAPEPEKDVPPTAGSGSSRTKKGVWISVCIGVMLGAGVVTGIGAFMPREQGPVTRPLTVMATPDPAAPLPTPAPVPTEDPVTYQRELARLILEYERDPGRFDWMISELLDLGLRATDTPVAEEAALQIVRVRRDRDRALEEMRGEVRREALQRLYEEGGEAARTYLAELDTPFAPELKGLVGNLQRRIRIWEQQKQEQREAESAAALEVLEKRTREWVPLVVSREWSQVLAKLDEAARDPLMFPVAEELAALRNEIVAVREIPRQVLLGLEQRKNEVVPLRLQDRTVEVQIRGLEADGLRVARPVTGEGGVALGTVELTITFSQLSTEEILRQLEFIEGPAADITRGLLAFRDGAETTCREALSRADTPLANAILNHLFALPTLDMYQPLLPTP